MNGEPITSKNARFETVTVGIQTVRVGAKQMTIAVFRQLPILPERYFDASQKWGFVRYNVDNAELWFVLAYEGKLYRFPHQPAELSAIRKAQSKVRDRLEILKVARTVVREALGVDYDEEAARVWLAEPKNNKRGDFFDVVKAIRFCGENDPQRMVDALRAFESEASRVELLDTCPQLFIAV
jgi:hypothetical protein